VDHGAAFQLGRDYFDQKDYANSAKWLRKLAQPDPDYLESLFLLGVDEFFLGHEAEAEKSFESLEKQIPLGEVSNNLGVMQARSKYYGDALASFERAYQSDSKEHEGDSTAQVAEDTLPWTRIKKHYDGRAFRLLSLTVRNALEESLASEPPAQHGGVHYARGEKFLAASRLPEAERELAETVSLLPQDADAHLALGQVYELEGRHQDAVSELETSLKLKDTAPAHLWLARVYLSLNQ